ncbi:hypothetical protein LB450_02755 [Psychroflexus sp. CAK1W]|uniref:hypothetical protein n=1 Tax=Psychroflexus curvus TaxID=2873595 RepID=UPI001CC91E24|nr:hypothetical protein [Psychroflexus curvus]MBZ9627012.1 hypothetical protein [Psychroflexus curvus]
MMKVTLTSILLLFLIFKISAQDQNTTSQVSVEKSIYGIQAGFLGSWLYNESRLSDEFALRSQVGFDFRIEGVREFESFGPNEDFYGILHLSLEPRWYYNLVKRAKKGKTIDRNSGNFIALLASTNLESVSFTTNDRIQSLDQIRFVPKWGIRRSLGKHFNYEAGFGFGYAFFLNNTERTGFFPFRDERNSDFTVDIHLRIGLDL